MVATTRPGNGCFIWPAAQQEDFPQKMNLEMHASSYLQNSTPCICIGRDLHRSPAISITHVAQRLLWRSLSRRGDGSHATIRPISLYPGCYLIPVLGGFMMRSSLTALGYLEVAN